MAYPTTPAFVHFGDWDEETRKHPSQAWMEHIVHNIFDAHKWDTPHSDLYTDDLVLLKPDGAEVKGGEASWAAVAELFSPFVAQHTEPFYLVTTDTDYGWEMIGKAKIYGTLPGKPSDGETKVKDGKGREWDVAMPGGFRFQYVKDAGGPHDGILMKMVQICTDSGPVLMRMLRRGLIKPADVGL